MIEKTSTESETNRLLADAIDEFTQRLNAGERPELHEFALLYPDCGETLQPILQSLLVMRGDESNDLRDADSTVPLPFGTLGEFELLREIGRGGMGIVYEAEQTSLSRRVALKVLPFAALLDERRLKRFRMEASAAAMLKHPNIVSVYSVGCERGVHYYAMELIDGPSLAEVIQVGARGEDLGSRSKDDGDEGPRSKEQGSTGKDEGEMSASSSAASVPSRSSSLNLRSPSDTQPIAKLSTQRIHDRTGFYRGVGQLGIEAADALQCAHDEGVVHRDIKPANLLLDHRGKLYIADFGLAQTQSGENLTMSGDVIGTLRYMSPEQLSGIGGVDGRTDVYSLGLTLYEVVAGQPAFTAKSRQELMKLISDTDPPALKKLDANVPKNLQTIIHRAIAKPADDRYQTASALADDLRRFLENRPIKARPSTTFERAARFAQRNRQLTGFILTTIVLLAALATVSSAVAWKYARDVSNQARQARLQQLGLYARDMRLAKIAADDSRLVDLHNLLLKWVPVDGEEDHRSFEWYHLWQYCQDPALDRSFDHELPVFKVTFLPGDREIAAGGFANEISIWGLDDNFSGKPRLQLRSPDQEVRSLTVWNNLLISGDCGGNVALWDFTNGQRLEHFKLDPEFVGSASPVSVVANEDGNLLAVSTGVRTAGSVSIWNRQRGAFDKRFGRFPGHGSAAFGPNDQLVVASLNRSELSVYRIGAWELLKSLPIDADGVFRMTMSPDKSLLAVAVTKELGNAKSNRIDIWETATWTRRTAIPLDDALPRTIEFSGDGKQIAAGDDDGILWMIDVGESASGSRVVVRRKAHLGALMDVAFSADGSRLASAGSDGFAHVWNLKKLLSPNHIVTRLKQEITHSSGACFTDGNRSAAITDQPGDVYIWDTSSGETKQHLRIENGAANITCAAACPSRELLAITRGIWPGPELPGRLVIWDLKANAEHSSYYFNANFAASPTPCSFSRDGRWFASCSISSGVVIVDVDTKKVREPILRGPSGIIQGKSLVFSPDGKYLAIGTIDGWTHILSLPEFEIIRSIRMDERLVDCVSISPDSRSVAAVGFDRRVKIYNLDTNELRQFADQSPAFLCLVRYTPDGTRILTAGLDGSLRLWMTETGEEILNWKITYGSWPKGEFSRDGRSFIVGGTFLAQVYHSADPSSLRPLNVAQLKSMACQKLTMLSAH